MKSPLHALVWEIWRKNRWTFALMAFLLAVCVAWVSAVSRITEKRSRLELRFRETTEGQLPVSSLFDPNGNQANSRSLRIKIGAKTVFDGRVSSSDTFSWYGQTNAAYPPFLTLLRNRQVLDLSETMTPTMTFSLSGGTKRTVSFAESLSLAEQSALLRDRAETWTTIGLYWSIICLCFSMLLIFAIFGNAEPQGIRGFTGLPPRQFTLPMRTEALILWPVTLGIASVVILWLTWGNWVLRSFVPNGLEIPLDYLVCLSGMGLAWFQAAVWSLPSFPRLRIAIITGLLLVTIALGLFPFLVSSGISGWLLERKVLFNSILAGLWGSGILAGWRGSGLERNGQWMEWARRDWVFASRLSTRENSRSFVSSRAAQSWIEWRTNGRLSLILWTILVWLILGIDCLWRIAGNGKLWFWDGLFSAGGLVGFAWLCVTGLNLARDASSRKLAISTFMAVRPIPSGEILSAKLLTGAKLWGFAIIILFVSWFVCAVMAGYFVPFWEDAPFELATVSLFLVAASLHFFMGTLPLNLLGRWPGFPWSLLPFLLVYGGIVQMLIWLGNHSNLKDLIYVLLIVLLGLKFAVAFWSFGLSIGRKICSFRFVLSYVILWSIAAGILLFCACELSNRVFGDEALAYIPAAVLIVPLARTGLSVLALDLNRHR